MQHDVAKFKMEENLTNIINNDKYFKFLNEIKNNIITTRRKVLTQAWIRLKILQGVKIYDL